jgi:hypothetical protein
VEELEHYKCREGQQSTCFRPVRVKTYCSGNTNSFPYTNASFNTNSRPYFKDNSSDNTNSSPRSSAKPTPSSDVANLCPNSNTNSSLSPAPTPCRKLRSLVRKPSTILVPSGILLASLDLQCPAHRSPNLPASPPPKLKRSYLPIELAFLVSNSLRIARQAGQLVTGGVLVLADATNSKGYLIVDA